MAVRTAQKKPKPARSETRPYVFNWRMSPDEKTRLESLAQHHGLDGAGLLRYLLKKEERAVNR